MIQLSLYSSVKVKEGKSSSQFKLPILILTSVCCKGIRQLGLGIIFFFGVHCEKWFKYRIKWVTGPFGVETLGLEALVSWYEKAMGVSFVLTKKGVRGKKTILSLKVHMSTKNMKCPR